MIRFVPLRSIALRMPSFGRGYDCLLGIQRDIDRGVVLHIEVEGGSDRGREERTCGAGRAMAMEGEVAEGTGIENLVGVIEHLDDNVHLLLVFGKEEVESYFLSRETGEFVFCSGMVFV